jgi:hypothetical protein
MDCAALANVDVSAAVGAATKITSAKIAGSGDKTYCAVQGVIAPKIRFELRLPIQGWTQRYLQVGCGGLCGVLNVRTEHADGCVPVQSGAIALASTDMGHEGGNMGDGTFGADPQRRIDFAYRGVHLTAVASKALIAKFYGQAPRYNYFSGCSDGGREALMEAQRFPGDFDGIAAGAPAMVFTVQNSFYHAWQAASNTGADGKAVLIASRLPILHAAALASCDEVDGIKDGQIDDPAPVPLRPRRGPVQGRGFDRQLPDRRRGRDRAQALCGPARRRRQGLHHGRAAGRLGAGLEGRLRTPHGRRAADERRRGPAAAEVPAVAQEPVERLQPGRLQVHRRAVRGDQGPASAL